MFLLIYNDRPNHSDRYSQHRRESTSSIQDRSQRANRNFVAPSSGGDRYRPAQDHFHLHQTPRPEYDSYRPPYEDSWTSPLRESISAPVHHRSPSYSHQRGGQTDSRAGGPLVSPKAFNRFPMRRRRGLSFSYNNDRNFHSADQLNYGSDSYHADHADHADDDEYRSYNSISRASSRSSIASTIPSERHDESPDTIVAESSTSVQNTREAIETFKDPTRSPAPCAPPSPCPPGLPSLNDSVSIERARIKSGAKDDVREENEVKEILSQGKYISHKAISFRDVLAQIRSRLMLSNTIKITWRTASQTVKFQIGSTTCLHLLMNQSKISPGKHLIVKFHLPCGGLQIRTARAVQTVQLTLRLLHLKITKWPFLLLRRLVIHWISCRRLNPCQLCSLMNDPKVTMKLS